MRKLAFVALALGLTMPAIPVVHAASASLSADDIKCLLDKNKCKKIMGGIVTVPRVMVTPTIAHPASLVNPCPELFRFAASCVDTAGSQAVPRDWAFGEFMRDDIRIVTIDPQSSPTESVWNAGLGYDGTSVMAYPWAQPDVASMGFDTSLLPR